jgi:hypothetical protein
MGEVLCTLLLRTFPTFIVSFSCRLLTNRFWSESLPVIKGRLLDRQALDGPLAQAEATANKK